MAKETVVGLARQVAEGVLDATEAGKRMRGLISVRKEVTTDAEKAEQYHSGGYEVDANSFVHVSALRSLGVLSQAQYAAILKALG